MIDFITKDSYPVNVTSYRIIVLLPINVNSLIFCSVIAWLFYGRFLFELWLSLALQWGSVVELIHTSANMTRSELGTRCDILWDSLAQPGDLWEGCSSHAPSPSCCLWNRARHAQACRLLLAASYGLAGSFPSQSTCLCNPRGLLMLFVPKTKQRLMP